ncbi:MAG: hypothetical protein AAFY20_16630 [Cyanobacteria bacterium J06639_14]
MGYSLGSDRQMSSLVPWDAQMICAYFIVLASLLNAPSIAGMLSLEVIWLAALS